ncbi:putative nucleotidyltransferase substrate binding domain-containing protein [Pseudoxanthomonas sp. F11]|uniref:putative nucleotidyltransferase substrate binding domain-containing protein n=1 Tax=Pseudoxanthomonas sp. F11 TaxID=3126308 RepID=UPI00300DAA5A
MPGLDLNQPPFDLLDAAAHARIAAEVDMGFHARGEVIMGRGQPSAHVMVILKGQVHAFDLDAAGHEQRFADYGAGDILGAWAVMAGRARHSYRADSDVVSFLIPAALFRSLLAQYPAFAAWFQEGLSVKGQLADRARGIELAELMVAQVGAAQLAPAIRVADTTSIVEATARLREERVDCLLVDDPAHPQPGVVTRTDLLDALTVGGLPAQAPVGPLASRPLVTQQTTDVLFQALVTMAERHIERVAVCEGNTVVGTLGMAEVLSHYASHSHLITLRLARARSLEDVIDAARGMDRLVRTLHAQGARMPALMELVSALNSRVMARLFELLVPAGVQSRLCLLVLGSEGRREQLLKTDQDNALVVEDGLDWPGLEDAMARFTAALAEVGYPPCAGGVMVSRPHWRLSATQWRARLDEWRSQYDPQAAMDLSITLDARPVAGNAALFAPLEAQMLALGGDERLLHSMASAVLQFESPLSFFGQLRQDERGLDIKRGGIFPVVHGLRCLALKHGIAQRSSFARCEALADCGGLDAPLARDLAQALAVLQRLRLDAQLAALDAGGVPDNLLHPDTLRRLDRELLRDALRVVKTFRQHVRSVFHLSD